MNGMLKSHAKITRPRYSDIFLRKKLFTRLDKTGRQPVVWVSSPPGFGKSILVSSYIESRKLPCLWYQVDAPLQCLYHYAPLAVLLRKSQKE